MCNSKSPFPAPTNKFVIRFIKDFVAGRPEGGGRTDGRTEGRLCTFVVRQGNVHILQDGPLYM